MKNTTNYGLKKPDGTDAVDIAIINQNMDAIDARMKSNATQIDDLKNNKANTSHGNHVPAIQSVNNKKFLRCDNTWQDVTPGNIGAAPASHTHTKSQITDFPTSLPANGGNADTVDGKHASDFASSTHNHDGAYASKEGVYSGIVSGGIKASDTRNVQYTPEWYMTNKPMSTVTEFKATAAVGITGTGSVHCYLETHTPWNDSSGGYPMQIAWLDTRTPLYRRGINATTWGAWEDYSNTDEINSLKQSVSSLMSNPKVVKSVQRGYISADRADYVENEYAKDYSIGAVDPSKTMINVYSYSKYGPISARLVGNNILRIYSNSSSNEVLKVSWEVIEFY